MVQGQKCVGVQVSKGSNCHGVKVALGQKKSGINVPGYTKSFSILINLTCIFINMGPMKNKPIILLLLVNRRLSPSISTLK